MMLRYSSLHTYLLTVISCSNTFGRWLRTSLESPTEEVECSAGYSRLLPRKAAAPRSSGGPGSLLDLSSSDAAWPSLFSSSAAQAEALCSAGVLISLFQTLAPSRFRRDLAGGFLYFTQWVMWRNLVMMGGRFTSYGMEVDVLEATSGAIAYAGGWRGLASSLGSLPAVRAVPGTQPGRVHDRCQLPEKIWQTFQFRNETKSNLIV